MATIATNSHQKEIISQVSLPDLANLFRLEELIIYLNIYMYYMTRDLTDQKGWGSSKAIRWYWYSLSYIYRILLFILRIE